jgi:hypothetical protein
MLMKISGLDTGIKYLPARMEVVDAFSSHKKLEHVFGQLRHTPLLDGLKRTWNWAKGEKIKPYALEFDIEIERNMPQSWR